MSLSCVVCGLNLLPALVRYGYCVPEAYRVEQGMSPFRRHDSNLSSRASRGRSGSVVSRRRCPRGCVAEGWYREGRRRAERLRADPHHARVEIHQQQPVPLQPRLEADVPPGRRCPVPAREVTLTARPAKRAPERPPRIGPSHSPAADADSVRAPRLRTTTRYMALHDPPQPVQPPSTPSALSRAPRFAETEVRAGTVTVFRASDQE